MEKCLIEQIEKSSSNPNLIGINELIFTSYRAGSNLKIAPKSGKTLHITRKSGHLYSDSAMETEISEADITASTTYYMSEGAIVVVDSKYDIKSINTTYCEFPIAQLEFITFNTTELAFYTGKLDDFKYLNTGEWPSTNIYQNVDKNNLTTDAKNRIILLSYFRAYGNPFESVNWMAGDNTLRGIILEYESPFSIADVLGNNPNLRYIKTNGDTNEWSSTSIRSSEKSPLSAQLVFKTSTDVDNFLINMAACQGTTYHSTKQILYRPARTSASDAAVSSLESRGFTINTY